MMPVITSLNFSQFGAIQPSEHNDSYSHIGDLHLAQWNHTSEGEYFVINQAVNNRAGRSLGHHSQVVFNSQAESTTLGKGAQWGGWLCLTHRMTSLQHNPGSAPDGAEMTVGSNNAELGK